MKLGPAFPFPSFASAAVVVLGASTLACSSPTTGVGNGITGGPPHALGYVEIGETHAPGSSSTTTETFVDFIPDTSTITSCTSSVGSCSITTPPVCDGIVAPKCGTNETCAFDATCKPTCQAECTMTCATGAECYFATATTQACRTKQSFDAGDLVFAGLGVLDSFTLVPPSYAYSGATAYSPTVPGLQIQLTSTCAVGAGYQPFKETFGVTSGIQSAPALSLLTSSQVYAAQGFRVGWLPGSDTVYVLLSGPKGYADCTASDGDGAYTVPASVISTVAGPGAPTLTVGLTRLHSELKTDDKTQGTLVGETVEPVGYLELATYSSETATITGTTASCTSPYSLCSSTCVDITSSNANCGACGIVCPSGETCASGACTGGSTPSCSVCETNAESGTCATQYSACSGDTQCPGYESCAESCTSGDSTCLSECMTTYPNGQLEAEELRSCICTSVCSSTCAGTTYCTQTL